MADNGETSSGQLPRFKVVLLGEGAVGKTSLLIRYIEGKFNPKHVSTLQASFLSRRISFGGQKAEMNVWDTAGQERFHALGPIYYRDAAGAVIVYDITDMNSFMKAQSWVRELQRVRGDQVVVVICGNKNDMPNRQVPVDTAEQYAHSTGAVYCETSAKLNEGIDELFVELAKRMFEKSKDKHINGTFSAQRGRNALQVTDDAPAPTNVSRKCC